jgi:hypothetical protein
MHYILIDYENVQPDIQPLADDFEIDMTVFVGPRQRVNPQTDATIHRMDTRAEIIKVSNAGPNALDFHLAFHLGQLVMADPTSTFEIISNDKGYDSLVQQLAAKGVQIQRTPGQHRPAGYQAPKSVFVPYHLRKRQEARPPAQSLAAPPKSVAGPAQTPAPERDVASLRHAIRTLERRLQRLEHEPPTSAEALKKMQRIPQRIERLRQTLDTLQTLDTSHRHGQRAGAAANGVTTPSARPLPSTAAKPTRMPAATREAMPANTPAGKAAPKAAPKPSRAWRPPQLRAVA